ncbi:hypothetical protein [Bradyrhizobium daqingense]|uniref:hypothetical protein n=1 Tax=Bradyrhizobium daqingense TaxID=993502 RepID=UPI00384B3A0C
MIIGNGFKKLEQRVTTALYGGRLSTKEAGFLQNILRRIELYRDRAFVSEHQLSWLFTILTNSERGTTASTRPCRRKPSCATRLHSPPDQGSELDRLWRILAGLDNQAVAEEEKPEAIDISKVIDGDGVEVLKQP